MPPDKNDYEFDPCPARLPPVELKLLTHLLNCLEKDSNLRYFPPTSFAKKYFKDVPVWTDAWETYFNKAIDQVAFICFAVIILIFSASFGIVWAVISIRIR